MAISTWAVTSKSYKNQASIPQIKKATANMVFALKDQCHSQTLQGNPDGSFPT